MSEVGADSLIRSGRMELTPLSSQGFWKLYIPYLNRVGLGSAVLVQSGQDNSLDHISLRSSRSAVRTHVHEFSSADPPTQ